MSVNKYVVWEYSHLDSGSPTYNLRDTKEDAFWCAYWTDQSDYSYVTDIEGPEGNLWHQFEVWKREVAEPERKRKADASREAMASRPKKSFAVRLPESKNEIVVTDWCDRGDYDRELARARDAFGLERVREVSDEEALRIIRR